MTPTSTDVIVRINAVKVPPPCRRGRRHRALGGPGDRSRRPARRIHLRGALLAPDNRSKRALVAATRHTADGPYAVEVEVLGKCLGLGGNFAKHSTLHRTFDRLRQFECADGGWSDTWRLRTHLPQLARRHLARLPESLQAEHAEIVGGAS